MRRKLGIAKWNGPGTGATGARKTDDGYGEAVRVHELRKREAGIFRNARKRRDHRHFIKVGGTEMETKACIWAYPQRNGARVMYYPDVGSTKKSQHAKSVERHGGDWQRLLNDLEEWAEANIDENCIMKGGSSFGQTAPP